MARNELCAYLNANRKGATLRDYLDAMVLLDASSSPSWETQEWINQVMLIHFDELIRLINDSKYRVTICEYLGLAWNGNEQLFRGIKNAIRANMDLLRKNLPRARGFGRACSLVEDPNRPDAEYTKVKVDA